MNKNRSIVFVLALAIVGMASSAIAAPPNKDQSNAGRAFDQIKALAGQWEATSPEGKVLTTYEVTSGGSAVLERIKIADQNEMLTVYHLDGNRLVLTHYCNSGNQPTMQADAFDPASGEIRFRFVSATNLASANAGHMHNAVIKFGVPDAFREDWTWRENGKDAIHVLQYHRVR